MNILVVSDSLAPERSGGIAKTVSNEAEWLSAGGHHVVVVSRRLGGSAPLHERYCQYEVYRYAAPVERSRFKYLYPIFTLTAMPRLVRQLCARYAFDVTYVHDYFQLFALEKMKLGIPSVAAFYASGFDEIRIEMRHHKYGRIGSLAARPTSWWVRAIQGRALAQANYVLVRSEYTRRRLLELYPCLERSSISRMPLGVDTNRFRPAPSDYRRRFGLPEDRPLVLTVRRLAGRMGLENLTLAMRRVAAQFPHALLVVAGKGYLEGKLRAMIDKYGLRNNVRLAGFVPERDLPDLYRAADLFVMPSEELEGFGLSTLEALACGVPVVATPVGANVEVLEELGREHLFSGSHADNIAAGLTGWFKRGFGSHLRQHCREYCERKFSRNIVTSSLENLFEQVVVGRAPGKFTQSELTAYGISLRAPSDTP